VWVVVQNLMWFPLSNANCLLMAAQQGHASDAALRLQDRGVFDTGFGLNVVSILWVRRG
jgi:hypothetical protein